MIAIMEKHKKKLLESLLSAIGQLNEKLESRVKELEQKNKHRVEKET